MVRERNGFEIAWVRPAQSRPAPHTCEAVLAAGLEEALAYNRLWGTWTRTAHEAAARSTASGDHDRGGD